MMHHFRDNRTLMPNDHDKSKITLKGRYKDIIPSADSNKPANVPLPLAGGAGVLKAVRVEVFAVD